MVAGAIVIGFLMGFKVVATRKNTGLELSIRARIHGWEFIGYHCEPTTITKRT